jgi:O-antigen/teichoic acid export membrane protein
MTTAHRSIFAEIRKLLSQSVIYGLGTYSTRVLGFFLIPVYTRYLVPADYGILGLANMASNLLFIILNLGQSTAFFRAYYDFDDEEGRKTVITTSIMLTLAICGPFCTLLILFAGPLARVVFGNPAYAGIFTLVCLGSAANVLLRIPFAILRAEEKAARYTILSVARGLAAMLMALVLVVGFGSGVAGVVWSQFASQALFVLLLLPGMVRGVRWAFSSAVSGQLLSFGTPIVLAGLSTFVLNLSDRYFLKHYASLSDVGIYSLAYNFGDILVLLVTALRMAYAPFVLSNMKSPHARQLYARVLTYYVVAMGMVTLGVSLLAKEVIAIMAAPSYHAAARVVPWVALAQFFHGLSFMAPIGFLIKRRPVVRSSTVFVAAAINLTLNFLWIPRYGMMGAAWSTAASFIAESALVTALSLRFYPIPFEVGRMIRAAVVGGALYAVGTWIPEGAHIGTAIGLKIGLVALYPVLLAGLGFLEPEEVAHAGSMLRTMKMRLGLAVQRS